MTTEQLIDFLKQYPPNTKIDIHRKYELESEPLAETNIQFHEDKETVVIV